MYFEYSNTNIQLNMICYIVIIRGVAHTITHLLSTMTPLKIFGYPLWTIHCRGMCSTTLSQKCYGRLHDILWVHVSVCLSIVLVLWGVIRCMKQFPAVARSCWQSASGPAVPRIQILNSLNKDVGEFELDFFFFFLRIGNSCRFVRSRLFLPSFLWLFVCSFAFVPVRPRLFCSSVQTFVRPNLCLLIINYFELITTIINKLIKLIN